MEEQQSEEAKIREAFLSLESGIIEIKEGRFKGSQFYQTPSSTVLHARTRKRQKPHETKADVSEDVARQFGRGSYFARQIICWERQWIKGGSISESNQGRFTKVSFWLADDGVQLAVRDPVEKLGDREFSTKRPS